MQHRVSRNVKVLSISMILSSALIAGGIAYAAGDSIVACVNKSTGLTRIISGKMKCYKKERQVTWNQTGPTGATGAQGSTGATGNSGTSIGYYKIPSSAAQIGIAPDHAATIFTITLPSGKYIYNFSTGVKFYTHNWATTEAKSAECGLSTESNPSYAVSAGYASSLLWPLASQPYLAPIEFAEVGANEDSSRIVFSGEGKLELNSATTIYLQCSYINPNGETLTDSRMLFSFPSFTAIKVDTLTDAS